MPKDRDIELQSLLIILAMILPYIIANTFFNWNVDFKNILIFFILWRVLVIEGTLFK